ncbi:MAG: helicase, partial [Nannocystaceae bacterium]
MTVRDHLIHSLRAELIGPYDPQGKQELLRLSPSRTYLTGFLAPPELVARPDAEGQADTLDADDDFAGGNDVEADDSQAPDPEPAIRKVFPASIGLSVLLDKRTQHLRATVRWGDYRRVFLDPDTQREVPAPGTREAKAWRKQVGHTRKPTKAWRRTQREHADIDIPLVPATIAAGIEVADQVWLQGRLADAGQGDGSLALALFVVNRRGLNEGEPREHAMLFQVEYQLHTPAGFVPRPDLSGEASSDIDDKISDLQYRDSYEYVVGHGVAARPVLATSVQPKGPQQVTTVEAIWVPQAEFKPVAARKIATVEVSMQELGRVTSPQKIEAALCKLPEEYEKWIANELGAKVSGLSNNRNETLGLLRKEATEAATRIRAGIELLRRDKTVRQAFVYANRAMFFQARQRGERAKASWAKKPQWRLFQLAFILLSLGDIAEPTKTGEHASFREHVDLIFFPTGGGKTEAYLGLIAFTLILRRLRGRTTQDRGEGVAVILRYTLRLLTLDQLERASTLICALEKMRAQDGYKKFLGERRFEIGLWVGSKASANKISHFKEQLTGFRADTAGNPCPLQVCPWCVEAAPLTAKSLTVESSATGNERVVVRCHNEACDFSQDPHKAAGLPIQFVDEQIYRELPCFVVATVDKFAMLPWRGETGMLFGRVTHRE